MSKFVIVPEYPHCDLCHERGIEREAHFDGKTTFGSWAFMCSVHYMAYGVGLGTGLGQRLILKGEQ